MAQRAEKRRTTGIDTHDVLATYGAVLTKPKAKRKRTAEPESASLRAGPDNAKDSKTARDPPKAASTPAKPRSRAPAEVVVFDDPVARIKAGQERMRAARQQRQLEKLLGSMDEDDGRMEFNISQQAVIELGASELTGKAKKDYDQKRLQQLGAKAPKNIKTPYNILTGMRKKQHERAVAERERAREEGMPVPKAQAKKSAKPATAATKKHWVDKSSVEDRRFRGGVLRVSSDEIARKGRAPRPAAPPSMSGRKSGGGKKKSGGKGKKRRH
eukprot:m.69823 g.69823  ORF g.69823 m.69823 type:complete len:271 (-) comp7839_c0_seq4:108-920(-)